MAQDNILITTSDNFNTTEIKAQYGVVDSQIVVGANLFRDVFASFRDIFGGETKGYKKDLDKMKKAAISEVKKEAKERGANAIISLRMDLDEVSGGGKSMFMLNTYGTAVKMDKSSLNQEEDIKNQKVTFEEIDFYKKRDNFKEEILNYEDKRTILENDTLSKITEYKLWDKEVIELVLDDYTEIESHVREQFDQYITNIPPKRLESYLEINFSKINNLLLGDIYNALESNSWFNYDFLSHYLKDQDHIKRFRALQLCTIDKDYYKQDESEKLRNLAKLLSNDFNNSIPTKEVSKMMGSKEVYVCPNCLKENKATSNSCSCGANRSGLKPKDLSISSISKDLRRTADAIESALLNNNNL